MRFSIVDFPAKPAKQKKQVALKKLFFFKIPDLALGPTSAPIVAENRR